MFVLQSCFKTHLNLKNFQQFKNLTRHFMDIKVFPEEPLIDEKLSITIAGLKPHQRVTVKSSVTEAKISFSAFAYFISDSDGNVNVHKQPSLDGTYTGLDSMGLFWSMVPDPGQQKGQRYIKRNVTEPQVVDVSVFDGHLSLEDCITLNPITTKQFQRRFLHKNATREEIRMGKLRGTMFTPPDMFGSAGGLIEYRAAMLASRGFITYALPYFGFGDLPETMPDIDFDYMKRGSYLAPQKGSMLTSADFKTLLSNDNIKQNLQSRPGPFPGVIDMFGSAGGLIEYRAAMLASRGFITYALPYFGFGDLPETMPDIDFDYMKETVDWFSAHPKVMKTGIGVSGVSKGGEIALMLALSCPQVKCVVNINGTPFCSFCPLGPFTNFVESELSGYVFNENGCYMKDALTDDFTTDKILKIWESDAKVLYIVGEDDQSVNPKYAQDLYDCYPEDQRHKLAIKRYPNAGHLIEPPYLPICFSSYHKVFNMIFVWGGKGEDHAKADEDSWSLIMNFFKSSLSPNNVSNNLSSHL